MRITKLNLYVGSLALLAIALIWRSDWSLPPEPALLLNSVAAFAVLGFLSEVAFLRLPFANSTSSVAFIPYLASILLLGPAWAMAIAGGTFLVSDAAVRRKPLIKIIHNTSKEIVAVGTAGLVYALLGGRSSLGAFQLSVLPFAAAVSTYFLINIGAPATAIALSSGVRLSESWRKLVGGSLLFDFMASPLALLLAFLYTEAQLWGIIVVTVPLFLIRHVYAVNLQIEQVNRDLLELMVKAIEARDPYTSGHSLRVSRMAGILARDIGLPGKLVELIETAALLHDVGKIHEEYASILRKEQRLTPQERALINTHPIRSFELVRTISGFRGGVDLAVRHHHENWDGSGYPDGLSGRAIPVGARIIMVADTVDAMTTDRPYRAALKFDEVVAELARYSGIQFDPELVEVLSRSQVIRRLVESSRVPPVPVPETRPAVARLVAAQ
jgi:putative nucleotidyltransferase with HDIG domain